MPTDDGHLLVGWERDGESDRPARLVETLGGADGDGRNALVVEKNDAGEAAYSPVTTSAVERRSGPEADVAGPSALDRVGATGRTDTLRYSGSITRVLLKGNAEVCRNGRRVEPGDLGG